MPTDEIKIESLTSPTPSLTAGNTPMMEIIKSNPNAWRNFFRRKNKPAGAFDIFKIIKYIYPLTIGVIVLILIWVMSFLYNNVYLTMTQAEIVNSLKSKVIEESVDLSKFTIIVKKISDKKNLANWPYLNYLSNPFTYGARTSYPTIGEIPSISTSTTQEIISTTTKATSTSN